MTRVATRISDDWDEALTAYVKREGFSKADALRQALYRYLEQHDASRSAENRAEAA
jgi:hypothetical protein